MDSQEMCDVIVIGAGTAGINAARQAKRAGAEKVLAIHEPHLLNTCVEAGCMPSKSILAGASKGLSLERIQDERDGHIERLLVAMRTGLQEEKFQVIEGHASFADSHSLVVKNGTQTKTCQAKNFVIATGSVPFVPPISGLDSLGELAIVSDDIVAQKGRYTRPNRICILGGGPIGLELATFFHRIGSEVVVIDMGGILSIFDLEFAEERLRAAEATDGFSILAPAVVRSVRREENEVICEIEQSEKIYDERFDALLIATGRAPNTSRLSLENTGVKLERGRITHDEYLKTSEDHIFVAGDVTGHHQILHVAAEMGKIAGYNAATEGSLRRVDYDRFMMAVSFDALPSALIGITEQEARKRNIDVTTATRRFDSIGLGILKRERFGMWKLVADRNSGKIIGSQVMGPECAGELMQILVPIIHNGNTYGDILSMPWYHPTFGEIVKSLANDMCGKDSTFCPGM